MGAQAKLYELAQNTEIMFLGSGDTRVTNACSGVGPVRAFALDAAPGRPAAWYEWDSKGGGDSPLSSAAPTVRRAAAGRTTRS